MILNNCAFGVCSVRLVERLEASALELEREQLGEPNPSLQLTALPPLRAVSSAAELIR
jgi:hypothetical protein